ncbi:MAG: TAXI family TRAP transporter solute-binding subunit [Alphaproteobacteria bacterium]|nr:TAXI family TRAP transporter solute-binding subunit [Alphaproteobacteria bacterium]
MPSVSHRAIPAEMDYQTTKTALETLGHMSTVHPAWKRMSTGSIVGGSNAQLHAGAFRYCPAAGVAGIEEFVALTSNQPIPGRSKY